MPFRLRLVSENGKVPVDSKLAKKMYVSYKDVDGRIALTRKVSSYSQPFRTIAAQQKGATSELRYGAHVNIYMGLLRDQKHLKWMGARGARRTVRR